MRTLVFMLVVGAFFLSLASWAAPVSAGPVFDDPQLCVNGKLLRVDPTDAPIDVFVKVGWNVTVDYNVVNCGGDPTLPVVDPAQVSVGGLKNLMQVRVETAPKTFVKFTFDGKVKWDKSNNAGVARVFYFVK